MRPEKKNLGTCKCPLCGELAMVRQMQTRKVLAEGQPPPRQGGYVGSLYLYCAEPDGRARCGVVQAPGPEAQRRILQAATWAPGCQPAAIAGQERPAPLPEKLPPVTKPAPRAPAGPLDF